MRYKKPLKKAQDTNIEEIAPVITESDLIMDDIKQQQVNALNYQELMNKLRSAGKTRSESTRVSNQIVDPLHPRNQFVHPRNQFEPNWNPGITEIDTNVVRGTEMTPRKEGGQVLSKFKSAARFDQPKFKNGGRSTKK